MTYNKRGFYVYLGFNSLDEIVYIGTTTQIPNRRFSWHKSNGKDLRFEVIKSCDNEKEMLVFELVLIQKHKPIQNKITNRVQNVPKKLDKVVLLSRKGNFEWCQKCFKRRNKYSFMKYCGHC